MSAEPTTAPPPSVPDDEPEARLRELEARFPPPTERDVQDWIVDRLWLNEQLSKGVFNAHYGKVLAVYNKELIGAGDNYTEMLLELSPKYNVHPERIVGLYIGE